MHTGLCTCTSVRCDSYSVLQGSFSPGILIQVHYMSCHITAHVCVLPFFQLGSCNYANKECKQVCKGVFLEKQNGVSKWCWKKGWIELLLSNVRHFYIPTSQTVLSKWCWNSFHFQMTVVNLNGNVLATSEAFKATAQWQQMLWHRAMPLSNTCQTCHIACSNQRCYHILRKWKSLCTITGCMLGKFNNYKQWLVSMQWLVSVQCVNVSIAHAIYMQSHRGQHISHLQLVHEHCFKISHCTTVIANDCATVTVLFDKD